MAAVLPTKSQFPQWEMDLLACLGAPQSVDNLTALNLWAQSEGSVTNNALATSGKGAGASKCVAQCGSSSPIYEYDTEADGVAQMCRFLKGSYYTKVVAALQNDAGLAAIYQAINSSSWCKGCQNGQYPVVLAKAVGGKGDPISPTVGSGQGATGQGGQNSGSGLSTCVLQAPGFLFFSGPCFVTRGGVKWLSGVAALMAGTAIGVFGVIVLAAYGFEATGARSTVTKAARLLPGPSGRVVRAAGAASGRRSSSASSPARTAGLGPSARPEPPPDRIERRYQETVRQQGPIGPRGGNPTARRIAVEARRGRSIPGAPRRQPSETERRRMEAARARAREMNF